MENEATSSGELPSPWPSELRLSQAGRHLSVLFEDGRQFDLSAEYLRVHSPSAELQGHGPGQGKILGGKRTVGIRRIDPVGHYAARLVFDDGHDTGLFTWDGLFALGRDQADNWRRYLEALAHAGLDRDHPGVHPGAALTSGAPSP